MANILNASQLINNTVNANVNLSTRRDLPWHSLGKVYNGKPITAREALKEAGADFTVGKRDIFYMSDELTSLINAGNDIPVKVLLNAMMNIKSRKATVRDDNQDFLGIVSNSYGIVQNVNAFDFVDTLTTGELGGEVPTIECAGVVGNGERIFITAKFPEPVRISNNRNDVIDMYIVFTTSHDGSGAVKCVITPIRVACNNALNLAFRESAGYISLRHTLNVTAKLDLQNEENARMAYKSLKLYSVYRKCFQEKLENLSKVIVDDKTAEKHLAKTLLTEENYKIYVDNDFRFDVADMPIRSQNVMTNALNSLYSGVGQEGVETGTGLWLVNGLTTYFQNTKNWTGRDTKKFSSIYEGNSRIKLQKMYNSLTA